MKRRAAIEPLLYIAPSLVLISAVFLIPTLNLAHLSLFDAHTMWGIQKFAGIRNFSRLLDPEIAAILLRTLIYVAASLVLTIGAGLCVAMVFNNEVPGKRVYWVLAYLPWAIPNALCALLWRWLVHADYGLLNHLLVTSGLAERPIHFLSLTLAMPTSIALRVWRGLPFAVIAFLSGLKTIPDELYESARVDGAGLFQRILYVTLPSMRGVIVTTSLIIAIQCFVTFDLIWVLTAGGPLGATETLPLAIYKLGFQSYDAGMSSALGLMGLLIIGGISLAIYYFGWEATSE